MPDYREFRRRTMKRRMWKRFYRTLLVLAVIAVLGCGAWFGGQYFGLWNAVPGRPAGPESQTESQAQSAPEQTAASRLPTPGPMQAGDEWNSLQYQGRTLDATVFGEGDGTTAMDFRLAGLPEAVPVGLDYFSDATFVGDSLTQGLQLYSTGLPNAHYCAYKSSGPQVVVNNTECTRADGGKEIPLEALVASAPKRIYVLYGTNVLVRDGDYSSFLAYYDQMLTMIQEALPEAEIYVQSITPVKASVRREKAGLYKERLMRINDELAALALQHGCSFVNLWDALCDEEDNLRADYAAGDGIHMGPSGYTAWVEYLARHVREDSAYRIPAEG